MTVRHSMPMRRWRAFVLAAVVAVVFAMLGLAAPPDTGTAPATTAVAPAAESSSRAVAAVPAEDHSGTVAKVLLVLMIILAIAKLGGDIFERIGQPAVLGELIFGILVGNMSLLHIGLLDRFSVAFIHNPETDMIITILSEIGVVLLLFEVGLEATLGEMMSVGLSSFVVAIVGVIAPMALGFAVGRAFMPGEPWTVYLFLGAVLAATSVGITARVLRDLGKMHLRESKIILGAAVIDDILGLIVLAVAQGAVAAVNTGKALDASQILLIIVKAAVFFIAAVALGRLMSKRLYRFASFLQVQGVLLSVTLAWCFVVAYIGTLVGLAPIVGAFAAGLVLEDATFEDWKHSVHHIEDLLRPVTTFLVPIFFVHMGMMVRLETFGQVQIMGFAACLTLAAIVGKQVCGLGVMERGINRLAVGLGMIPRGEVGLIVANIGATMRTAEGHPVISPDTFSASVIMVVVTTMITPPLLKWSLERRDKTRRGAGAG
ncbi:MAG: cation:proton antiporter [bacterium]